ncbi:response regulator [Brevibacillus sp. NSP2.1]|uniref:response regulator n=1 Tax=Brevibacillus sp. NSP2.1 TaxID=3003229 RepID=UPI00047BAB70|nr:response regulator [Brevibacillus sp. NSP2.1]QHZ58868.1 response regulator [Brevibacillus sp. NSP2.1]
MSENIYEKSVHILLVEDDPVNVQVICNHFSLKGWKVTVVQNGKDALEKIASLPFQVVLLTAKSGTNDVIEGFRSGANDYLTKPVTREELFVRIEAQLTIVRASGELTLLKEAVQAGTSSLRHAVKNDLGVITLFSEKIKEYAEQEQLDAIIQDASVIIRKNNHLFEMMQRVNHLTSDIVLKKQQGNICKCTLRPNEEKPIAGWGCITAKG